MHQRKKAEATTLNRSLGDGICSFTSGSNLSPVAKSSYIGIPYKSKFLLSSAALLLVLNWLGLIQLPFISISTTTTPQKYHADSNIALLLHNGTIFDSKLKKFVSGDVLVHKGKIVEIDEIGTLNLKAYSKYETMNLKGKIIAPGLIDMHTHIYWGSTYWGIEADPIAAQSGVTTWNDAGSSGCYNFDGFKEYVIDKSVIKTTVFLNVVGTGLVSRTGELAFPDKVIDVNATIATIENHSDIIKGLKVRMDTDTTAGSDIRGLIFARELADKVQLPLMVHLGHAPPTIIDIEPYLKKGDILTHAMNGHENKHVDNEGHFTSTYLKLKAKGVLFDIGHGGGSFNYNIAEHMLKSGFMPDTISSDLHQVSRLGTATDLPTVISKLWNLGLSLEELLYRSTLNPARILKLPDLGYLHKGGPADIAIFEIQHGSFNFTDAANNQRPGTKKLVSLFTFKDGILFKPKKSRHPTLWALRDAGLVSGVKP